MSCTCPNFEHKPQNNGIKCEIGNVKEAKRKYRSRLETAMRAHAILGIIFAWLNFSEIKDGKPTHAIIIEGYLTIPNAHQWRMFWVIGVISIFKAVEALHYKDSKALKKFRLYVQVLGVMPIVLGNQVKLAEIEKEYNKKEEDREHLMWNGYPIKFIWFFFFSVAFIIHGFELYMTRALINIWKIKTVFEMKEINKKNK